MAELHAMLSKERMLRRLKDCQKYRLHNCDVENDIHAEAQ